MDMDTELFTSYLCTFVAVIAFIYGISKHRRPKKININGWEY